jgi:hypothetical protein
MVSRRSSRIALAAVVALLLSVLIIPITPVQANRFITNNMVWNSGIAIDSEGDVAYVGSTVGFSNGPAMATLLKYSPSGKLLCFKTFGGQTGGNNPGALDTFGYGVAFDTSNNMYVTGTTQSFGGQDYDVFLLKFDSSCNLLFPPMQWGGPGNDVPRGIATDSADNVYITGYTDSFGAGGTDLFLLKYRSADNKFVWFKTWGGPLNDYGTGVEVDLQGNVYVTGYTNSLGGGVTSVVLLKFDSSGNLLMQKTWGGNQNNYASGIALDSAGNVYVSGTTYSSGVTAGVPNVFLLKYDLSGNLLYQKTWGGTQSDFGAGVTVDSVGNAYVTGYTYSSSTTPGVASVFLLKYNPAGTLLMEEIWGGRRSDYGYGIAVDAVGQIYISGYTFSFGPNTQGVNVFLLKYDLSGNLMFQKLYGGGIPDP